MNQKEKDFHISHHEAMAQHCTECAKAENQCAASHEALAELHAMTAPELSKHHSDLAEAHKDTASSFVTAGENHLKCCKNLEGMETEKTEESSDLKIILGELQKLTSAGSPPVSAVPRFDNTHTTLVPRAGQPQPQASEREVARAALPEQLRNVIFDDKQARG